MAEVMTVRGPISPDDLGITMCHVHVLSELKFAEQAKPAATMTEAELTLLRHPVTTEMLGTIRRHANDACAIDNNLLGDLDLAIIELNAYKKMGGSSIVETSVVGLKRDPAGLRRISAATGVNIICGTGWYIGGSHAPVTRQSSIEQLSGIMVHELTAEIEDTGIRAGFIKAGLSGPTPDVPFQGAEEKVLRAGARAQAATGATMTMHPCHHYGRARHLHTYLDILQKEGANLNKCYMSHMEFWHRDIDYQKSLLDRGVTLSYDQFGCEEYVRPGWSKAPDSARVEAVVKLVEMGYAGQIVLSNEVVSKFRLRKYGGLGYAHLLENIVPDLKYFGVTDAQIHTMLVENPRRLLPF
jgi:phosphotriesterase-related protein